MAASERHIARVTRPHGLRPIDAAASKLARWMTEVAVWMFAVLAVGGVAAETAVAQATVAAWGVNSEGQLGDDSTVNSDLPMAAHLPPSTTVTAVSAGEQHSLALLSDGTVLAWGGNGDGQLGDGTTEASYVPVRVSGLSGVGAISTSASHSLALLENGTVMAWGDNDYGELGDDSTANSDTPVQVHLSPPAGIKVTAVSAGEYDSLAVLSNGAVMAWGYNFSGQLGDGTTTTSNVPVAVIVPSGSTVTAISAGWEENIALLSNGTAIAWGNNSFGLLGDGSRVGPEKCGKEGCSRTPVAVSGLSGVAAVSTSMDLSLALLKDGDVMAWGSNYDGQLGDGTTEASYVPVAVSGLSGATAISASLDIGLALLEDGNVTAWGYNGFGGLGVGSTSGPEECGGFYCSRTAIGVSDLTGVTAISSSNDHSLAIGVPPPSIATPALPGGQVDNSYAQTLAEIGGVAPYTWSIVEGSLPTGLHLNGASGEIVGTPSAVGSSTFTVLVTDSSAPSPRTGTASLTLVISSAAEQAAEYGSCTVHNKGEYGEAACQAKSAKVKKGSFEWTPGPAPSCVPVKKGFYADAGCTVRDERRGRPRGKFERAPGAGYTSTTGPVTLTTPGLGAGKVVCASGVGVGEITTTKAGRDQIMLTGCEALGKRCASEGPNSSPSTEPGVILTNLLATKLVGSAPGEISTQLMSSEHEPYLTEFNCEGSIYRVFGSVSGVQTGGVDTMSLMSTTSFAAGEGEQALYTEQSETGGASWVGPDASSLSAVATNMAASATEIRA